MSKQANHLRQWRLMKGWTQTDVSKRVGVTKGEMSRLESGERRLTVEWLDRFASIYGVTTEEILSPPPVGFDPQPVKRVRSDGVDYLGQIRITLSGGNFLIVAIAGDEMSDTIRSGDRVVVDREANRLTSGGVFAIALGGETVIRRLQLLPGDTVSVTCDNPAYRSVDAPLGQLEIVGRAYARVHRL